jgi:uncharacterized SAM-binding protein YcdF (DUF218 family)
LFFSNSFIYNKISNKWNISHELTTNKFDYGILLGGMISLNSTENNIEFLKNNDRLLNTIDLYNKGVINNILITGASGSMKSEMKESLILKKFLKETGIPSRKIIIEQKSKNTNENAVYSEQKLTEIHPNKNINCLIITSGYHMRRSLACFKKTNLNVEPFSKKLEVSHFDLEQLILPQSNILFNWKVLLHEIVGYFTYLAVGYV